MSSPRLRFSLPAAALLATLAGGCTFHPLYSDVGPNGQIIGGDQRGVGPQLSRVTVATQSLREGIELRNQLIFVLSGGGREPDNPLYRLEMSLTKSDTNIGIEQITGRPTSAIVYMAADYKLIEIATGKQLYKGRAISRVSYDKTVQRFANYRAELDAEKRAADELAQFIRNGLAAYFANPSSAPGATPPSG